MQVFILLNTVALLGAGIAEPLASATTKGVASSRLADPPTGVEFRDLNPENKIDPDEFPNSINKMLVDAESGQAQLVADIKKDHRIFGFSQPSRNSKSLVLFSIYTNDVKDNIFGCEIGAFYDSQELEIRYLASEGDFVKTELIFEGKAQIVYFDKNWVEFNEPAEH